MEKFYCVSMDGDLYALGNHGDWEAADDTAQNLGLNPIWVFGEETFNNWRTFLNNAQAQGE